MATATDTKRCTKSDYGDGQGIPHGCIKDRGHTGRCKVRPDPHLLRGGQEEPTPRQEPEAAPGETTEPCGRIPTITARTPEPATPARGRCDWRELLAALGIEALTLPYRFNDGHGGTHIIHLDTGRQCLVGADGRVTPLEVRPVPAAATNGEGGDRDAR